MHAPKDDKAFEYTGYCTTFCFKENGIFHVWMWDEIKDRPIMKHKCPDKEKAERLMDDYVGRAPEDVICQKLE